MIEKNKEKLCLSIEHCVLKCVRFITIGIKEIYPDNAISRARTGTFYITFGNVSIRHKKKEKEFIQIHEDTM